LRKAAKHSSPGRFASSGASTSSKKTSQLRAEPRVRVIHWHSFFSQPACIIGRTPSNNVSAERIRRSATRI
jgi:hypothetical protein